MIAKALVLKIFMMCMYGIEPSFNKKECVKSMLYCTKIGSFEDCADFWEPTDWEDPKWYYGDPSEADLSY